MPQTYFQGPPEYVAERIVTPPVEPPLLVFLPSYRSRYDAEEVRKQLDARPRVAALPADSTVYQCVDGRWELMYDGPPSGVG